jgi:hypothetical protein
MKKAWNKRIKHNLDLFFEDQKRTKDGKKLIIWDIVNYCEKEFHNKVENEQKRN